MPHYADGTEAKLGDNVRGKPYNTAHEVTGTVVGVIPGSETCNVRVAFARALKKGETHSRTTMVKGFDHDGNAEQGVVLEVDYGETKAFVKL